MARDKQRNVTRVRHAPVARQDGQPLGASDVKADPAGSAAAVEAALLPLIAAVAADVADAQADIAALQASAVSLATVLKIASLRG